MPSFPVATAQPSRASHWHYWRTDTAGIVELASWHGGGSLGLRPHFHDEAQLVFVLAGARSFLIGNRAITVSAGKAACIPAHVLHAPLANGTAETRCLNLYLPATGATDSLRVVDIREHWRITEGTGIRPAAVLRDFDALSPTIGNPERPKREDDSLRLALTTSRGRIGDLAASLGRSREDFSRRVSHAVGVAPHRFRLLARLNLARRLLRADEPIAAVAAETDFADQSHLGRLFRATFGTTPGRYRHG
ncbi:helix-turn-helix domain-containing protein [Telmatospirillum siberiense]|uniref:helix-turn-helix domain-containing protein n=1 Tax=Telmatospirillum siberiense TaxID=382514 RepID=UPI00130419FB|nr:AraC family transcriptional regulator [Telmatospirillum siberiense]